MGVELINQGKVDKTYQELSQDMQKTIENQYNLETPSKVKTWHNHSHFYD